MRVKTLGFPRMIHERGEKRDFIPSLFKYLQKYNGIEIFLENTYGEGVGYTHEDYLKKNPHIKFVNHVEALEKDIVIVLKAPMENELKLMKKGSALFSMLHYDTRTTRNELLLAHDIKAFSMDSIEDDDNNRMVVNYYGTSRAGTKVAFYEFKKRFENFSLVSRKPLMATIIGMGGVGLNSAKAFEEFSDKEFLDSNVSGVMIRMLPRSITKDLDALKEILKDTDILVDASKRLDTSKPILPNNLILALPDHAIILDLSADPYNTQISPKQVKGIEGIPTGNLEKYIIEINDKLYDSVPHGINSENRRVVVSCNAWPGVDPVDSMMTYEKQLRNFLKILVEKDLNSLSIDSEDLFERALVRSSLNYYMKSKSSLVEV